MFEIEQIINLKMDLALNILQRLICHKTQPTNQMSSYSTCLIKNSYTPMSLAMDLIDLIGLLSVMAWISPTNFWVLFRMRLLCCCTFVITIGLIQLFLNPLLYPKVDSQILCIGASGLNAKQYNMPLPNLWRHELCHSANFHIAGQ